MAVGGKTKGEGIMTRKNRGAGRISWPFFLIGVCLMAFAFYLGSRAFDVGTLTSDQRFILLWVLPLASGFLCGAFAGNISARTKKGYAGWAVAATGGFAVWILSYFLLPSTQDTTPLPDVFTAKFIQGMSFQSAAEQIAQNDNSVIEFIGFTDDLTKRKIVKTRLSGEDRRSLLKNLRLCVDSPESFPEYTVTHEERGKYVLRIE